MHTPLCLVLLPSSAFCPFLEIITEKPFVPVMPLDMYLTPRPHTHRPVLGRLRDVRVICRKRSGATAGHRARLPTPPLHDQSCLRPSSYSRLLSHRCRSIDASCDCICESLLALGVCVSSVTSKPDRLPPRDAALKSASMLQSTKWILFVRPSTVSSRWPPEIRLRLLPTTTMKCLIRPARNPRQCQEPSPTFQPQGRKVRARTGSPSFLTVSYRSTLVVISRPTLAQALAVLIASQVRERC